MIVFILLSPSKVVENSLLTSLWVTTSWAHSCITTFRILQKNYAGPDVPMEAFEKETLADWQETINSKRLETEHYNKSVLG